MLPSISEAGHNTKNAAMGRGKWGMIFGRVKQAATNKKRRHQPMMRAQPKGPNNFCLLLDAAVTATERELTSLDELPFIAFPWLLSFFLTVGR